MFPERKKFKTDPKWNFMNFLIFAKKMLHYGAIMVARVIFPVQKWLCGTKIEFFLFDFFWSSRISWMTLSNPWKILEKCVESCFLKEKKIKNGSKMKFYEFFDFCKKKMLHYGAIMVARVLFPVQKWQCFPKFEFFSNCILWVQGFPEWRFLTPGKF